ncbi:MAG: Bax inhibitor-1/YccA family protein [Epsilonproteobacteria bacterium]|nr:Bax inhibitor-1/YccA family protein [Campylobacterota bacterium]
MALYDREYIKQKTGDLSSEQTYPKSNLALFIKQTYQLFAASLLAASVGSYVGVAYLTNTLLKVGMDGRVGVSGWFWGLVILEFALLFGLMAAKKKEGLNLLLLFAFTFVSGLTLAPTLAIFLRTPGGAAIVTEAFILTTVAFGGLSIFAMNTKRDFSAMGKMLFITLIVVIVASLLNIFINSSLLQLGIASVSSILFSAFILYDTQNIIRGNVETPVEAAVSLYLDFINLFMSLLQILGIFSNRD